MLTLSRTTPTDTEDTISRRAALLWLARHGWSPTEQTCHHIYGDKATGSSFFEEFGDRERYSRSQLMAWLGY